MARLPPAVPAAARALSPGAGAVSFVMRMCGAFIRAPSIDMLIDAIEPASDVEPVSLAALGAPCAAMVPAAHHDAHRMMATRRRRAMR